MRPTAQFATFIVSPSPKSARRHPRRLVSLCPYVLLLLAGLALGGCGNSSGDAASDANLGGPTGSASVFITDAPSDQFDQILVSIESLQLIAGSETVTLFSGGETIDLKELENFSDLFVHAENVPTGEYEKIRMRVGQIQLVKKGRAPEIIEVELPANGQIDLVPSASFVVREDIDLVIELDLDARKSIHSLPSVERRYAFRPVILLGIRETIAPRKLTRVHGQIRRIFDDQNFVVCSTLFMASRNVPAAREPVVAGGLGHRHRCMTVELNRLTGVFDADGAPVAASALQEGSEVTVVGRFHLVDANHDHRVDVNPLSRAAAAAAPASMLESFFEHRSHRPHGWDPAAASGGDGDPNRDVGPVPPRVRLVLLAYVVEMGPPGTFLRLRGALASGLDARDRFEFAIAPGQGFGSGSAATAELQTGTRVFTRRGIEVDDSEIVPDTEARIDGVFRTDPGAPSLLKTALLVLDIDAGFPDALRGRITQIEAALRRLFLEVDSAVSANGNGPGDVGGFGSEACVDVPDEARIFVIRESSAGASRRRGSFDDLEIGWGLHVYGRSGGNRCLLANTILAFPPSGGPPRCRTSDQCEAGQFCRKPDRACAAVGVCAAAPEICLRIYAPVCGCDRVTYGNRCEANGAGASVLHEGECRVGGDVCGGFAGIPCPSGHFCAFPDGECRIADGQGVCEPQPDACPEYFSPVCGCDGVTYSNRCFAAMAGVAVSFNGSCRTIDPCICDLATYPNGCPPSTAAGDLRVCPTPL